MRSSVVPALLVLLGAAPARAVDVTDTRLLSEPAVSESLLAFAYANDLWIAGPDGSGARRLTSHPGVESGPRFSPDGTLVAFTGRYEGNTDVYVIPAGGGEPRRLTWHPGDDVALGFTPDGAAVLFSSPRSVYTRRYTQLFTVPVEGGFPTRLAIPHASKAAISPDGRTIAYLPLGEPFLQWKHYRGGTASRILLFDTASQEVEVVPQPEGRCNDTDPMWIGGQLYFRSDRDGEFNVYAFDRNTKAVTPLTSHDDFPVLSASAGGERIVYEQAGAIHSLDPSGGVLDSPEGGGGGRPRRAAAALGEGCEVDPRRQPLPVGRPRRPGVPGRDRDRAPGEGRRPQPHPLARRPRALSRLVPRRGVDRLRLRRERRVRAAPRGPGRERRGPRASPRGSGLLRRPSLVAGFEDDQLRRQRSDDLDPRRRHREADPGRRGRGLRAPPLPARGQGLVAGLALARLHPQHADLPQRALPLLGRRRDVSPGGRRPRRRHAARLRRLGEVPLLPRVDRRRDR